MTEKEGREEKGKVQKGREGKQSSEKKRKKLMERREEEEVW